MMPHYVVKYFILTMPDKVKYWAIGRSKERLAKRWSITVNKIEQAIDYWGLPHISEYEKDDE
jgi:hypothetical protein